MSTKLLSVSDPWKTIMSLFCCIALTAIPIFFKEWFWHPNISLIFTMPALSVTLRNFEDFNFNSYKVALLVIVLLDFFLNYFAVLFSDSYASPASGRYWLYYADAWHPIIAFILLFGITERHCRQKQDIQELFTI